MSLDAPATVSSAPSWTARPALPAVGTYVSAVWSLGLKSFRAALPALAFQYFFHLGARLYIAFTLEPDAAGRSQLIAEGLMLGVASIPLLFVVYAPVLVIQDTIHQGGTPSFSGAARQVLGRTLPLLALIVTQALILFGPPLLLLGGVALMVRSLPSIPGTELHSYARAASFIALIPCGVYVLVIGFLQSFAHPALILDSRGPLASIRSSFFLVASHFGGVLGRLLVFGIVFVIAYVAVSLPIAFIQMATALSGFVHPAAKVADVIWEAAVSAVSLPFQVAAALVLYRSLRPAGAVPGPDGSLVAGVPAEPSRRATSPFQFE